jgi:hypothetical protein
MSRRIAFSILAAIATLTATPAIADRECFADTCRLTEAAEPPAQAAPQADPSESAKDERNVARADAAPRALPQVLAEPAPPQTAPAPVQESVPQPAVADNSQAQGKLAPLIRPIAAPKVVAPKEPRRAIAAPTPAYVPSERAPSTDYAVSQAAAPSTAVVVAVPGTIYPDGAVVPAYPHQRDDPAWTLCQGERRGHRNYNCGPYSYHPYGAYGHRPNGTYSGYRTTPGYVIAPSAKVISIDSGD